MARFLIAGVVVVVVAFGVGLNAASPETSETKAKDAETVRLERLYLEVAKRRAGQLSKEELHEEIDRLIARPTDDPLQAAKQAFAKDVEEQLADEIRYFDKIAGDVEKTEIGRMADATRNVLQQQVDAAKLWVTYSPK